MMRGGVVALAALSALALAALTPVPARAAGPEPARPELFVVAVGNNRGFGDDAHLRYAESDAARFTAALQELASPGTVRLLLGDDSAALQDALREVHDRIALARSAGRRTLLVVYYSGHADADFLRLAGSRLTWVKLKELIRWAESDLTLTFVDACESGAATTAKGASLGPPFEVHATTVPLATGSMWITSSRRAEASFESEELGASVFSHYLVSGLRGAADVDEDGRVTLAELYQFAYDRTVGETSLRLKQTQHPTYETNLSGEGEVVLTEPPRAGASLVFPRELGGHYYLARRFGAKRSVLEVPKQPGALVRMSVPSGAWVVYRKDPDRLWLATLELRDREEVVFDASRLEPREYQDVLEKGGGVVLTTWEVGIAAGLGAPVVSGAPAAPEVALSLVRRELSWGVALGLGLSRREVRALDTALATESVVVSLRVERFWDLEAFTLAIDAGPALLALRQHDPAGLVLGSLSPGLVGTATAERAVWDGLHVALQAGTRAWLLDHGTRTALQLQPWAALGLAQRF